MSCKVGSYPAGDSAQGLKDMAGNVLEFTTTDNDARSDVRIARGGSWRDGTTALVKNSRRARCRGEAAGAILEAYLHQDGCRSLGTWPERQAWRLAIG